MESLIYTALRDIAADGDAKIWLSKDDLWLEKPTESLLAARWTYAMGQGDFDAQATATRFLVCKYRTWDENYSPVGAQQKGLGRFYSGLMALQVIKPIQTFGHIYSPNNIESRPRMVPGPWALTKHYDAEMLGRVPEMIARIQRVTDGAKVEPKNALTLLQLGLEHFHPLIAGLFWVMGMEAIFNSTNRNDFKTKLCDCLGADTLAFPQWSTPGPAYTVGEIALDLYMLRNKLAHGRDLREARLDKTTPVDLTKQVQPLGFAEPTANAAVLSEAACFLLCQVLQKTL